MASWVYAVRTPHGTSGQGRLEKHFRGDLLGCTLYKALDSPEKDSQGNRHSLNYSAELRSWEVVPRATWYGRGDVCSAGEGKEPGPQESESYFNAFGLCCVYKGNL